MASIDTPLVIVGGGPAALVAAKIASGSGLTSLIAGYAMVGGEESAELDESSIQLLEPHGVLGILTPYASSTDPFAIAPRLFEEVLKHHCVVDMNVTVYDEMELIDITPNGEGVTAIMTDGRSRWDVQADAFLDAGGFPVDPNGAIHAGATAATEVLNRLHPQ